MTSIVSSRHLLEIQRFSRSFVKEANLTVIILLAVAILSLPYILKENELPLGKESYYHLRIANKILNEKNLPKYDELSYSGRESFMPVGFPFLIALTSFVFRLPVEIAMNILLFLLGIISVILFYYILKNFNLGVRFFSCLVLIISPIFIYLFIEGGIYTVPVVLSLLLIYFILNKKYYKAAISFIFIPFFDWKIAILIGAMLLCYFLYNNKKRLLLISIISLFFILSYLYFRSFNLNIISDFGSKIGLSVFSMFLFVIGFGLFWEKKKFLLLYLICFLLLLFSFKFDFVLFYLNLFLSVVVSACLIELYDRKWESNLIKNFTLLLLVCGLLFSGVSYAKNVSEDMPSEEFFEALSLVPDKAIVFSSLENGYWLNYAGKKSVVGEFTKGFETRFKDYDNILIIKDAEISRFLLNKYNVDYILIDKKMRKEIWENRIDGLLWVLNYDIEHFSNVYDGEEVGVWGFIER